MLLNIVHKTVYRYDESVPYALQRVRLVPSSGLLQQVRAWSLDLEGAREEARFADQFANHTRLLSLEPGSSTISVTARGQVETSDLSGVAGAHWGYAPLWLFLRPTALTRSSEAIAALAEELPQGDGLERLHALKSLILERVAYEVGSTSSVTSAEEAFAVGHGVCQDHAHIFIAACRALGYPARYVSGYLLMDGVDGQVASHAWAEAHVDGLGWVGFDVSNGISPDERYVRLAIGRDYRDAMPVAGIRHGAAQERLEVHVTVEQ